MTSAPSLVPTKVQIQCDQMVRFFFQSGPITPIKIGPMAWWIYQSNLNVLTNTNQTLKKWPQTFKMLSKVAEFHQIWSLCSNRTPIFSGRNLQNGHFCEIRFATTLQAYLQLFAGQTKRMRNCLEWRHWQSSQSWSKRTRRTNRCTSLLPSPLTWRQWWRF